MGMNSNFNKWINLADFLHVIIFKKAKSYFNSYWMGMVKYGYVLLGHRTLCHNLLYLKNE